MRKTAYVFSGQGAQFAGMGRDLAEAYAPCRALYAKADEALGFSLSSICFEGPMEALTRSHYCQPAIFVTSMACQAAWRQETGDARPVGMAGLSLGEWTALHAAGALSFEDAVRTLEARGRFMQEACDETRGAMVSVVGLAAAALEEICRQSGAGVSNFNSLEQTVLSGEESAVEEAERLAREAGAKRTVRLKVAGAFHSPLMQSAARKLERYLEGVAVQAPSLPVLANTTGRPHGDPAEIRREMVRQVTQPVRWLDCMEWFRTQPVDCWLELGPGRVLAGLIKRVDRESQIYSIQDISTVAKARAGLAGQKEA